MMQVKNSDMIYSSDFIREFKKNGCTVTKDSEAIWYLEIYIFNECRGEKGSLVKYVQIENRLYKLNIDYIVSYRELIITNVKTTLMTNYFDGKKSIVYDWLVEIECSKTKINEIEEILKRHGIKVKIN